MARRVGGGSGTVPTAPPAPVRGGPVTSTPVVVKPKPSTKPTGGPLPSWWGLLNQVTTNPPPPPGIMPISRAVSATDYLPLCYGACRVSTPALLFAASDPGGRGPAWGGFVLLAWSEGPIQSVDTVYCNGNAVRAGFPDNGYMKFDRLDFTGVPNELVGYIGGYYDATLGRLAVANKVAGTFFNPSITASFVYSGTGWWTVLGANDSGSGIEWAADVHGLKIYDPRLDSTNGGLGPQREGDPTTWTYSTNPVLICRDLYMRVGQLSSATIDDSNIIAMADASDTAGFSCSICFGTKMSLDQALAAVLQTCNGMPITSNGKRGIFLDLPNASPAVLSLSEEDGDIADINFEWLSARDRYTQVIVSFNNKDADYKADATPPFGLPGTFSSEATFPVSSVDTTTDTVTFGAPPGWAVNDTVLFMQNGGSAIGGLNDGQVYYVRSIAGTDVTLEAAIGAPIIDLTGSPVVSTQYFQRIGPLYPPTIPVRPLGISAQGINTMAAATILRDYLYNSQAITFRVSGWMSAKGILLTNGNKVSLSTLKGVAGDYVIVQIVGTDTGFFQFVAKPYSADVFSTTPISVPPPVVIPPANPQDAGNDVTVTDASTTKKVAASSTSNTQTFNLYQIIEYQLPSAGTPLASLVVRGFAGTGAHSKTWADMLDSEVEIPLAGNEPPPDSTHNALTHAKVVKTVEVLSFDAQGQLIQTVDTTAETRIIIKTKTSANALSAGVTVDVDAGTNTVVNPRTDVPRWTWRKPTEAVNGSRVTFAVPHTFVTGTLMVVRDGQVCVDASFSPGDGADYSVSGLNVTFTIAPQSYVAFFYQESVNP